MGLEVFGPEKFEKTPPNIEKHTARKNAEDLEESWLEEARVSYCGKERISFSLPTVPPGKS